MLKQCSIGVSLAALLTSVAWSQVIQVGPDDSAVLPSPDLRLEAIPPQHLIDDVQQPATNSAPSDVWVGLGVEPVSDALRAHIDLPVGAGLIVHEVVPDSPAAAAGIQRYDILLTANDTSLATAADLMQAVRESAGGKISLQWQRAGRTHVEEVAPAPRPKTLAQRDRLNARIPGVANPDRVRDWLKGLQQGAGGPNRLRVPLLGGPGQSNGNSSSSKSVTTNNLSIQIQKQNDEPAKVTVKRDGDTWEVDEDTLDELPDDIRPQVERMVKGNGISIQLQDGFPLHGFVLPDMPRFDFPDFDKRFEQMNQRMEQMLEQMRRIEGQPAPAKPEVELDEA